MADPPGDGGSRPGLFEDGVADANGHQIDGKQCGDRNKRGPRVAPSAACSSRHQSNPAEQKRERQRERDARQLQIQIEQIDASEAAADDHQCGDNKYARASGARARCFISRVAPRASGNEAAGGRRRKDVVIELETGDAEEADHRQHPDPEQLLVGGPAQTRRPAAQHVDPAAGDDRAPRKERARERPRIEDRADRPVGEFNRLCEVPQISGQHVSFDELTAEPRVHPEKPWRCGDGDRRESGFPAEAIDALTHDAS